MTLTYPELVAIGGVLAAHKPVHQHLVEAVDRELREARKSLATVPAPTHETESECDKIGAQMKTVPAGNRDLTATTSKES